MASDSEYDNDDVVSERETQFIPRSDDDEVLWEVLEITAERGKKYKVKWDGVDPATGKPWAQSWVAKHDCTDKLVAEWMAKKRKLSAGKRPGGRTSTTSRASSAPKWAGSSTSTSDRKTRRAPSEASSRLVLDSVERSLSSPAKKQTLKRRRQSEALVKTTTTSGGEVRAEEEEEEEMLPRKRQKTIEERLVPQLSSDEDEMLLSVAGQNEGPSKRTDTSLGDSDVDYDSLPKANGVRLGGSSSKASGSREESRLSHSKAKPKVVIRRKERVVEADVRPTASQDEVPRPPKNKTKPTAMRRLLSEQIEELSEQGGTLAVSPIKVGPPRGVKHRDKSRNSGPPDAPGPSRAKSPEQGSADRRVAAEASKDHASGLPPPFSKPMLLDENAVDGPASETPPSHVSTPKVPSNTRPRSPILSPGAKARLELFDRMMEEISEPEPAPPAGVMQVQMDVPAFNDMRDSHDPNDLLDRPRPQILPLSNSKSKPVNPDDTHDFHNTIDLLDHPRSQAPPSNSKSKSPNLGTANGLIVPETESSQSQSQSLHMPPSTSHQSPARDPSPRKVINLPTIAVIAASVTSASASPQDLVPPPQKLPLFASRPSEKSALGLKPVPQISPATFRMTINAHTRAADPEAPPSSIESFTPPQRADKGKQKAVEGDQLESGLSEGEGGGRKKRAKKLKWITELGLKKRGKELSDQAQPVRAAERKKKRKAKRLKSVNEIVNGTSSPFVSATEGTLEVTREEVVDLSGANSATLDTPGQSELASLSEEARERLRITLRQEEEETTQEAMGIYLLVPARGSEPTKNGDSSKNALLGEPDQDVHVEQPSAELQQASVVVHPSQEQLHEDTDVEPLPTNQTLSSPVRPIPENLTDSPKRRLGEALSLLNVKSEEIQRLERKLADERANIRDLKAKLDEVQQSSEPTGPLRAAWEAERAQWTQERSKWGNDLSLWDTQRKEWSHERENLLARIAELSDAAVRAEEAHAKLSDLEAERGAWTTERDVMLNEMTQRSEELAVLTNVRGEYEQDKLKWEEERASWAAEKAKWEAEREALQEEHKTALRSIDELTAQIESITAAKVSVEKDRDFFREQYAQASGFVGSVREENVELEKRTKIAEGQAREGVAAIKMLFEGRINALQADVNRWKGLAELLQEKDRRTNDEIRLRAAQCLDLGDLCARLQTENRVLRGEIQKLGRSQQRSVGQRNKLYFQVIALKKERASLRSKLPSSIEPPIDSIAEETLLPLPAPPSFDDPENMDPNDMDMLPDPVSPALDVGVDEPVLFPCMWRPEWRDQCPQTFDSKEDLERHVQEHFRDLVT